VVSATPASSVPKAVHTLILFPFFSVFSLSLSPGLQYTNNRRPTSPFSNVSNASSDAGSERNSQDLQQSFGMLPPPQQMQQARPPQPTPPTTTATEAAPLITSEALDELRNENAALLEQVETITKAAKVYSEELQSKMDEALANERKESGKMVVVVVDVVVVGGCVGVWMCGCVLESLCCSFLFRKKSTDSSTDSALVFSRTRKGCSHGINASGATIGGGPRGGSLGDTAPGCRGPFGRTPSTRYDHSTTVSWVFSWVFSWVSLRGLRVLTALFFLLVFSCVQKWTHCKRH
jgi:hypothetical protein